jgi:hypothetical protein
MDCDAELFGESNVYPPPSRSKRKPEKDPEESSAPTVKGECVCFSEIFATPKMALYAIH